MLSVQVNWGEGASPLAGTHVPPLQYVPTAQSACEAHDGRQLVTLAQTRLFGHRCGAAALVTQAAAPVPVPLHTRGRVPGALHCPRDSAPLSQTVPQLTPRPAGLHAPCPLQPPA